MTAEKAARRLRLEVKDEADELFIADSDPAVHVGVKLTKRRRQRL